MKAAAQTPPLVTVIVPVYNAAAFLERCIDSILGQSMGDLELIAVNDGSTDASLSILRDYEAADPRVRVLDQANAGQGAARNRAIDQARGKFILFVDADDFIERVTLQVTTERALEDGSDLVHFDWKFILPSHRGFPQFDYYNVEPFWHERLLRGAECEQLFRMHSYFSVTNLYRAEFLRRTGARYETGQIYEDNPFLAQVFVAAETVSLVHSPLYAIQANPESSTKTGTDTGRHMRDHLEAVRKSFDLISPRDPNSFGYLADYHVEKFSIYYQRRVPKDRRKAYAREFVTVLGEQNLQFGELTRKTSWLTKTLEKAGVFDGRRSGVLEAVVRTKDAVAPPAKRVFGVAKKLKRRVRHPLVTLNNLVFGRNPVMDENLILFLGFDYRYTGNSRALFEEVIADGRFARRTIKFVTTDEAVPAPHRVKPESLEMLRLAQRAAFLIAETWIPASIPKHPDSTWIQLWHGTPIKRMLFDSHEREITRARPRHKVNKYRDVQRWDHFLVDGELAAERFQTAFLLPHDKFVWQEYPRVSRLRARRMSVEQRNALRVSIGGQATAPDLRIVLYAPTWWDYNYQSKETKSHVPDPNTINGFRLDHDSLLFKGHPFATPSQLGNSGGWIDVHEWDIDDLLVVADLVVTDWSSVRFDAEQVGIEVATHFVDGSRFLASRGVYSERPYPYQPEYQLRPRPLELRSGLSALLAQRHGGQRFGVSK